jgi:SAM-dependent methyltransferase
MRAGMPSGELLGNLSQGKGTVHGKRLSYPRRSSTTVPNLDAEVVRGFGDEWQRFDQAALEQNEHQKMFDAYFNIFPWHKLRPDAQGFDLGCGSGRWARKVAPRVGSLSCIDPSPEALAVARRNLSTFRNVTFHLAAVDNIPIADGSMDFGYCLGVLHHVPRMEDGLSAVVAKLKQGAPFLLYVYYAFDNQPRWYAYIWKASDFVRKALSRLPFGLRYGVSQIIAAVVYYPLARFAAIADARGVNVKSFPLAAYRHLSFYSMRTDALDRFGTRLENRFTRAEIFAAMTRAGLTDVSFSEQAPYWCAVGIRA